MCLRAACISCMAILLLTRMTSHEGWLRIASLVIPRSCQAAFCGEEAGGSLCIHLTQWISIQAILPSSPCPSVVSADGDISAFFYASCTSPLPGSVPNCTCGVWGKTAAYRPYGSGSCHPPCLYSFSDMLASGVTHVRQTSVSTAGVCLEQELVRLPQPRGVNSESAVTRHNTSR